MEASEASGLGTFLLNLFIRGTRHTSPRGTGNSRLTEKHNGSFVIKLKGWDEPQGQIITKKNNTNTPAGTDLLCIGPCQILDPLNEKVLVLLQQQELAQHHVGLVKALH